MNKGLSAFKHAHFQAGFTLTEISIVLGIVGLVISFVWSATKNVYLAIEAQTAQRQINDIIQSFRQLFAAADTFPTDIDYALTPMFQANFPSDVFKNGVVQTAFTQWTAGQGISVGSNIGWGSCPHSPRQLQIVLWNLPIEKANLLIGRMMGPDTQLACIYSDCYGAYTTPQNPNVSLTQFCTGSNVNIVFEIPKIP
jgi:hypothetical protein